MVGSGGARKKSWGGSLKLTVEKLFKVSQNRPIIELFKFFGWATTPLCGNLDQPKLKTDIKLYKISQNRPIIEIFKFFGWATTSLCGNLDQPKPKTDTKLYKISQNRPIIVDFLNFGGGPWPTSAHEGLRHCILAMDVTFFDKGSF